MKLTASSARGPLRIRRLALALGLSCAAGLPVAVQAQAQAQSQTQSQTSPPTRQDLNVGRPSAPAANRSRLSIEGGIEHGPCPLADPAFAETRVNFSRVEFTGLPDVPASALEPAWRDFAGRDLPVASLCEVRDRAATMLRGMGFLAAVQVPPQRIEAGGPVHMDVLAAKLAEVQLRGNPGPSERLIESHLAALTKQAWFNTFDAERQLLLLGDLPGYNVRLVLRSADAAPGEVVGDIVLERTPLELAVGAQNLGSRATGREGAFAALTLNDLIGLGDRTTVSYFQTLDWDEQRIVRLSHDLALGASGLRLGGSLLFAHSEPDVGANFKTDTFAADVGLTYPLIRRQAETLVGGAGLEIIDQQLAFGGVPVSEDDLRVIHARLEYQAIDRASIRGYRGFTLAEPRWRGALSLELRQGLGGLGASPDCSPLTNCLPPNVPISNLLADPSAFVARLEGAFEFRPVRMVTLAVSPLAQWSDGPLLSYEQVSLGNYTIGRGFDPGVAQGDRALGASFELRYGTTFARAARAVALQPFVFLDYAKAWLDDAASPVDPRRVVSAGGGLRGRWGDLAEFSAVLAVPLERAGFETARGDTRVLFTLITHLLPWRTR
ncbi:MAG: ShlB/FhaC/HecB family hemolysin secretion/activation protein [Croceibacterium sp.]